MAERLWADDFDDYARWYAQRFQRLKGKRPSDATLTSKCRRLATAANAVGAESVAFFGTLLGDPAAVEGLLNTLSLTQSSGSLRGTVYALMDFAEWAKLSGYITESAVREKDLPPPNPQKAIVVYSDAEVELMLAAARGRGLRWWAFLTFLADTGRRVGEALSLEYPWMRLDAEKPYVELPFTKNGTPQYVPLSRRLREDVFTPANIEKLKVAESPTMARSVRSCAIHPFPWNYGVAHTRFVTFCKTLDIEPRGFHNLRHTRATAWLTQGVPMHAVSKLLGHSTVVTTDRIYNHATALSFAEYVG